MGLRGVATNTPDRQSGIAGSNPAGGSKIALCLGTRPEAIKLWPVYRHLMAVRVPPYVFSSGQHEDMLAPHLAELGFPITEAFRSMERGQPLAHSISRCILGFERLFAKWSPDLVVVQGDTTTAVSAALVAFGRQIPVAHVEGGVRSYQLAEPFPEEGFRRLIGQIARWSYAPSLFAYRALKREQVLGEVILTGNPIVEAVHTMLSRETLHVAVRHPFVLATCHRREARASERYRVFCETLAVLAGRGVHVCYPVHANSTAQIELLGLCKRAGVELMTPMSHLRFLSRLRQADCVLTDSGGVVEEAAALGVPVVEFRAWTDRIEAHTANIAVQARSLEDAAVLADQVQAWAGMGDTPSSLDPHRPTVYGDAFAGQRIADHLRSVVQPLSAIQSRTW